MLKQQAEDRKKAGLLYQGPQGEDIHPDIVIQSYKGQIESDEAFLGGKESESSTKSRAQRVCFFIGVLSIFVSYLIPKLCEISHKASAVKTALISLQ